MSSPVSDRTRSLLARSLPLVQQRRILLVERIAHRFAAALHDVPSSHSATAAAGLVGLLVDQAKRLGESGAFGRLDFLEEHRALDIDGRHYSCFGDALVPILRDLLPPTVPREVAGAWCDTFWAVLRAGQSVEAEALA
jgi:hypothetical protein